jgi:hypothetical protein
VCPYNTLCDKSLFFGKRVHSAANTETGEEREGRSVGPALIPFGLRQSDRPKLASLSTHSFPVSHPLVKTRIFLRLVKFIAAVITIVLDLSTRVSEPNKFQSALEKRSTTQNFLIYGRMYRILGGGCAFPDRGAAAL